MGFSAVDLNAIPDDVRTVIANHLLDERGTREPNHRAEVRATTDVITALLETPDSVLAKLSETVRRLTEADSAGVSLSGYDGGHRVFLWQAAVGLFEKYLGSVVIHEESPCGSVLDADALLLMTDPGRVYKTAAQVQPPIQEVLLVPFHVGGRPVGTVWAISQGSKRFDAEDARIVTNISKLAALSYQVLTKIGDLELLSRTVQLVADEQFTPGARPRPKPDQ